MRAAEPPGLLKFLIGFAADVAAQRIFLLRLLGLRTQKMGEKIPHRKPLLPGALLPALGAEMFVFLFSSDKGSDVDRRLILSAFVTKHGSYPSSNTQVSIRQNNFARR